jgi:hypothetical protein
MELRKLFTYILIIFALVVFFLNPYGFDLSQTKDRTSSKQFKSITILVYKFLNYLALSAIFIALGLVVGVLGYHWAADLSWLDALVEASMILSGMGPINPLLTTSAKVFASLYALFSGLIFVIAMGIVLSPLVYSLLNQFHINLKQESNEDDEEQKINREMKHPDLN